MSRKSLYNFMQYLYSRQWSKLFQLYFDEETQIKFIENGCLRPFVGIDVIQKKINGAKEILQYNIESLKVTHKAVSFKIMLVTKDNHLLDFVEHDIKSIWKDNKIIHHQHKIVSY